MIEISYYNDGAENDVTNARCSVCIDDNEATLADVVSGLIKVAKFAGYNSLSFDNLVTEYVKTILEEKIRTDYGMDRISIADVKVDKDYTFEDFIFDKTCD